MILWLDEWIGRDENCRDLKMEFRRLTNSIKFVYTVESCREVLLNVKNRKLFFITQGKLAKEIVPDIERIISPSMEPVVYLFCAKITKYNDWAQEHDCIMAGGIYDFDKDLLGRLTHDLNDYIMQKLTESREILIKELRHRIPDLVPEYIKTFTKFSEDAFTSSHARRNGKPIVVQ